MPLLNEMDKVYTGGVLLDAVYLGADKIWPVVTGEWGPDEIAGLGVWLEADAITGLSDGASVTSWPDQSGYGRHAVPAWASPTWQASGVGVNDHPGVQFAYGTGMKIPGLGTALSGKSEHTMFYVLEADSLSNRPLIGGAPVYDTYWQFLLEFETTGEFYWGQGFGTYHKFGTVGSAGTPMLLSFSLPATGEPEVYTNGVAVTGTAISGGLARPIPAVGADVLIGGYANQDFALSGRIAAVLWYDRCLTVTERQQVEDYLHQKYFVSEWTPASISGLVTWLDAADYVAGSWPNKGPGPAISIVGTPAMTAGVPQNGLPTVRFKANEARVRGSWATAVHDWTLVYLVRFVGPTAGRAFSAQYPPSNLLVGMHTSGYDAMYDNGTWLYGPAYGTWPTTWRMYGADSQSGQGMGFFVDGTQIGTRTGGTGGLTNGWAMSGYDATGSPETMDIEVAEMVLYDHRITDPERVQVENYLKTKWAV